MQIKRCPSASENGAGGCSPGGLWRVFGLIAAMMLLNACSSSTPPSASAGTVHYIVTAESTPFYKYGPAQASGADMQLYKSQGLTMLERHYGYSRVETLDGQSGFVPTDDIAPAPNAPATASAKSKHSSGAHGMKGSSGGSPVYDQPNDAALPSTQPPSDAPAPSFRY